MNFISAIIRGRTNLEKYCEKRFGEQPHFVETIGRINEVKVYLRYWSAPAKYNNCTRVWISYF